MINDQEYITTELKDSYSTGAEESKIKRLKIFLSNEAINPEKLYEFFAYRLLQKYKFKSKSIYIIFDHTTIDDRFVILQFSLKVGKRAIPLWFKLFGNIVSDVLKILEYLLMVKIK